METYHQNVYIASNNYNNKRIKYNFIIYIFPQTLKAINKHQKLIIIYTRQLSQ